MLPRMMINCLVNCQIMSVSVSSLCNSSIFASKASLDSVGYDLLRASRVRISPGCRALVPTGLAIKLRGSIYVKIAPRLCYPLPNFDAIPGIVNPESLCRELLGRVALEHQHQTQRCKLKSSLRVFFGIGSEPQVATKSGDVEVLRKKVYS